jgi:hypothetical protein
LENPAFMCPKVAEMCPKVAEIEKINQFYFL